MQPCPARKSSISQRHHQLFEFIPSFPTLILLHSVWEMDRRAAKLPNDILIEILALLPPKSFVRFKCVSKLWLALTSDPSYHGKFPHTASGIFFQNSENFYISLSSSSSSSSADTCSIDTTLNFLPSHEYRRVINCCNGLLLVFACDDVDSGGMATYRHCYYVCNPATREWVAVPMFRERVWLLALTINPHVSHHFHLLGYQDNGRFMIFSSKTWEWATVNLSGPIDRRCFRYAGIFFRGVLHVIDTERESIVGVNLEEGKVCRMIKLPKSNLRGRFVDQEGRGYWEDEIFISNRKWCPYLASPPACGLGFSGGYLHYALEDEDDIHVWILRDCERAGEWVLKYSFDIKEMLERNGLEYLPYVARPLFYIRILAFHPDMDVVFLLVGCSKVLAYHKNSGRFEEIYSPPEAIFMEGFFVYSSCLSNGLLGSERA